MAAEDNAPDIEALLRMAAARALEFRQALPERAHTPAASYAEMCARLDGLTPEHGQPGTEVIAALDDAAQPGLNAMAGPRFFGWVIGGSHPVGVAADWLTGAWGQNAGNHIASPAAAAAETVAAKWLLDILQLPPACSVGFVTGATMASFVALAAARGAVLRRVGWDVEANGLFGAPPIKVLIGDDAHTTVFSALQYLGLGHDRVVRVAADETGCMRPAAFAAAAAAVTGPAIAITQAGQINTGAFDRFPEILSSAHARGMWVHVDGAFGLWARACPATAHLAAGVEGADSWSVDGHKWLQVPFDSGYAIVRDVDAHRRAMTTAASYLPAAAEDERDPVHYVPELSRRARGFATWAMLRALGREGIAAMVARHCAIARRMATLLAEQSGVALLNDVVLNQAILRFGADRPDAEGDSLTEAVIARVQAGKECFVGGARWRGRWVMRISVIGGATTMADGERAAAAISAAWRDASEARALPPRPLGTRQGTVFPGPP